MPRYSKNEFIALAFIEHAYLSVNIKRLKVIPNTNNEIDTTLQINQDFLDKCIAKENKRQNQGKPQTIPTPKAPQKQPPKITKRIVSKEDAEIEKGAIQKYDLETIKKQLEIESKEQEIKINKIKLDKLNGVVIPTELVMVLFGQHSKSITTAFHQAAENFVVEMAGAYSVNKKDQARMRGDLIAVVNKAIEDSLEISRNGIDNIVDEYAINGK